MEVCGIVSNIQSISGVLQCETYQYLGDGVSNAHAEVCHSNPYDVDVNIVKD